MTMAVQESALSSNLRIVSISETVPAEFVALDERFTGCDGDYVIKRHFSEARKTEGPAYFAGGRYLVFSDIPNDRLLRYDETTGAVGVLRHGSG
ncbi:hypothetical protein APR04_004141 [Promicromonospora umidemergens]|uniref:Uncharacterized protein n=1 Tax=Promicromonospora umidemergens TaxID=629679 RepID=A0ABP8XSG4_9MICO|nr:hypothetical protein [Promicromonospora umidemergens]